MTSILPRPLSDRPGSFRHEVFLYATNDEYLGGLGAFVVDGLRAGDAVLAVLDAVTIDSLRFVLGPDASQVCFADMAEVGRNPGRIISAWHDFLADNPPAATGRRGIGEPVWAERSPAELVECIHHESLLNLAFAPADDFWLLCPYDTSTLAPEVVDRALTTHPFVLDADGHRSNTQFAADIPRVFDGPLEGPPTGALEQPFDLFTLPGLRRFVAERAGEFGMPARRMAEVVLAVNEVATNSLVHGGGSGSIRAWTQNDSLVYEIHDQGCIDEPLVGRLRPADGQEGGFGVWLANQLCDLVQIRSGAGGTIVRLSLSA